jgi:hypothetical protein
MRNRPRVAPRPSVVRPSSCASRVSSLACVRALTASTVAGRWSPALRRAYAGGFELPDNGVRAVGRGGANAVGVSDLTAVHYNPAMLARQAKTFSLMYNHNLVFHEESFQRAPLGDTWGPTLGGRTFEKVEDDETLFPLGGFFAVGSDFGSVEPGDGQPDVQLRLVGLRAERLRPAEVGRLTVRSPGCSRRPNLLLVYYSLSAAWQAPEP